MKRELLSSGAPWEEIVGYSRAVRVGNTIEVSGTTAVENGSVMHIGDPAAQARAVLEKIKSAIEKLGGTLEDVVRTRMFVTDISRWEEIGKVHGEFFSAIKPATTMVEVSKLIDPEILVEIEATAIVG